jgi:hypothetical protein
VEYERLQQQQLQEEIDKIRAMLAGDSDDSLERCDSASSMEDWLKSLQGISDQYVKEQKEAKPDAEAEVRTVMETMESSMACLEMYRVLCKITDWTIVGAVHGRY